VAGKQSLNYTRKVSTGSFSSFQSSGGSDAPSDLSFAQNEVWNFLKPLMAEAVHHWKHKFLSQQMDRCGSDL